MKNQNLIQNSHFDQFCTYPFRQSFKGMNLWSLGGGCQKGQKVPFIGRSNNKYDQHVQYQVNAKSKIGSEKFTFKNGKG